MWKEYLNLSKTNGDLAGENISFWRLLVFILILAAAPNQAQQLSARPDRGMSGRGGYQSTDIDSISLQNGGVNLQIPLASLPPIAGGKLSYTLTAFYNSKIWNVLQKEMGVQPQQPGCQTKYSTERVQVSDAGGWQIGGQYQIFFRDAHQDYDYLPADSESCYGFEFYFMQGNFFKPMLRLPDGSEHELKISGSFDTYNSQGTRDHLKGYYKQAGGNPNSPNFSAPVRLYTIDGSYLSVVVNPTSYPISSTIFMKDGTRIENSSDGQRIKDTNGNSILRGYNEAGGYFFAKDEQTGREIKWSPAIYNGQTATEVEYQSVGGIWQSVWVVWGTTNVQGKLYYKTDWNSDNSSGCFSHEPLPATSLNVVREIIFPKTEQVAPPPKFSFVYNSDTSRQFTSKNVRFSCSNSIPAVSHTRTVSYGLGELSQVTTPSGAQITYEYLYDNKQDFTVGVYGPAGNNENPTNMVKNVITRKKLSHDGTTDTWTYNISTDQGNNITGGSVINPDGSTRAETYYPINIAFSAYSASAPKGNMNGLGGLIFKTIDSGKVLTEKHWALLGGAVPATGAPLQGVGINPVVDAEYTSLLDDAGNRIKMSAKKFQYDYNGELIQAIEYDWFSPNSVIYDNNVPIDVPASATVLKTVNNSYYNQALNATSPNAYQNRQVGDLTMILGALQETIIGAGKTRFSYDGQAYNVPPVKGNLTQVSAWNDTNSQWINVSSVYDNYGNIIAKTDGKGFTTQIFYEDGTRAMPTKTIVDPQNGTGPQSATTTYDFYTGLPISSTDINGNISSIDYTNLLLGAVDPLGRPGTVYNPYVDVGGTNKRQTVKTYYEDSLRKTRIEADVFEEGDALLKTRESRDQLDRPVLVEKNENGANSYSIFAQTIYFTQQRVVMTSNAGRVAAASTTDGWTRVTSDVIGRPIEAATFSTAVQPPVTGTNSNFTGSILTSYYANETTVTDQAGKKRRSINNALGQLIRVDEPNDLGALDVSGAPVQPTSYVYDALGNLKTVTQTGNTLQQCGGTAANCAQTRTFLYDSLSRLKSAANPESGTISYQYDNNGNVTQKIDARGVVTTYGYDALNRVISRSYNAPAGLPNYQASLPVAYTYDNVANAKGRLTKISNGFSTTEYLEFDSLGRIKQSRQTTDGVTYNPMFYAYYLSGTLKELTYPSGRKLKNTLDANGDLSKVETQKTPGIWETRADSLTYTSSGAVSSMKLGNNRWESTQFNSRLQPTRIGLGTAQNSTNLLQLNYDYGSTNNNGNVLTQTITVPNTMFIQGFTATQTYTYDSLNRLKSAQEIAGNQTWKQTFNYDRFGNRSFDEANTDTIAKNCFNMFPNFGFAVCDADKKLLNPSIAPNTNRINTDQGYLYDASGNLTKDATGKTFVYDGENKQTIVKNISNQNIGEYFFDGDGKRVKKVAGSETIIFVYDAFGKLVAEYSNQIAQQPKITYLTNDHLGTPRINTDANGAIIARHDYYPFGEEILTSQRNINVGYSSDAVRQKFTGYERDMESGLDFAQARMYSNKLGRFTAVDPVFESIKFEMPQTFNRYTYTLNNPLLYVDPDGELWIFINGEEGPKWVDKCPEKYTCLRTFAMANRNGDGLYVYGSRGSNDFTVYKANKYGQIDVRKLSEHHDAQFIVADGQNVPEEFLSVISAGTFFNVAEMYSLVLPNDEKLVFTAGNASNGKPGICKGKPCHGGHTGDDIDLRYMDSNGKPIHGANAYKRADIMRTNVLIDLFKETGFLYPYTGNDSRFGLPDDTPKYIDDTEKVHHHHLHVGKTAPRKR